MGEDFQEHWESETFILEVSNDFIMRVVRTLRDEALPRAVAQQPDLNRLSRLTYLSIGLPSLCTIAPFLAQLAPHLAISRISDYPYGERATENKRRSVLQAVHPTVSHLEDSDFLVMMPGLSVKTIAELQIWEFGSAWVVALLKVWPLESGPFVFGQTKAFGTSMRTRISILLPGLPLGSVRNAAYQSYPHFVDRDLWERHWASGGA